jgi:hypothetical protein
MVNRDEQIPDRRQRAGVPASWDRKSSFVDIE